MRVTILGSGSSSGVPGVGIGWGACDPDNPKNRRLRPSILIESNGKRILVDASPDLRYQLLHAEIEHLDAVVFTHGHADHLNGLDDLRGINRAMNAPLNVFADATTLDIIGKRFAYVLEPLHEAATIYYKPVLNMHEIVPGEDYEIAGMNVRTFEQDHGYSKTIGFRFNDFGYTTDMVKLPEEAFSVLEGVCIWLVGIFSDKAHKTHIDVDKALKYRERIQPKHTIMTHLGPNLDYAALIERLPEGAEPAFDFMSFIVPEA